MGNKSDSFLAKVTQLCCAYSATSPAVLIPQCRTALGLYSVLEAQRRPGDAADITVARGWLTLLIACLLQDAGRVDHATQVAQQAEQVGRIAGHPPIVGWAREIYAWQANSAGRYREAVRTARDAADALPDTSDVVAQLRFQQAMAEARLGDRPAAWSTFASAERTLSRTGPADHPDSHFALDRQKLVFYGTKVHDAAANDRGVAEYAAQTLLYCQGPQGTTRWPMRMSETQMALAHLQARAGNMDAAAGYGMQALSYTRVCVPILLGRGRELQLQLAPSKTAAARDYDAMLQSVARERGAAA